MQHVTFSELAMRFGKRPAFNMLRTLERLAQIRDEIASLDMETRFQKALQALSEIDFAA